MKSMERRLLVLVVLVVVVVSTGCTKANPKSCVDGVCNDQEFPFCDVDGSLAGEPGKCIAVACTPGEIAECRDDVAVTCNATGNNYDLVSCPASCDVAAGGCIECQSDSECANPEPVCEGATRQCRGCQRDDECASGVCNFDSGACVAAANVVYAIPDGTGLSPCSMAAPCSLNNALTEARGMATPAPIRMLPGLYDARIVIGVPKKFLIVGAGATLRNAQPVIDVESGADVEIRDLIIVSVSPTGGVGCGFQTPSTRSFLTLRRVTMLPESDQPLTADMCTLKIVDSEINVPGSGPGGIRFATDSNVEVDRTRFRAPNGRIINFLGERMKAKITNSIFDGVGIAFNAGDASGGATQSDYQLAFNTFVDSGFNCSNAPGARQTALFENNIFWFDPSNSIDFYATFGAMCTFRHNIFNLASGQGGTNRDVDPKFVDLAARNFQLAPDSPAIDTAVPSAALPATPDVFGVTRPQGSMPDVGAHERKQP